MPALIIAELTVIAPFALAGSGILLLIVVALLKRSNSSAKAPEPAGEDLLAQAEEVAFQAVAHKTGEMPPTAPPNAMDASATRGEPEKPEGWEKTAASDEIVDPEKADGTSSLELQTSDIDWEEQEDVYRPETVDALSFVSALDLERPPDIEPEHTYIFIRQSAYAQLREHLRQDLTVELGGLLCGQAFHDPSRSVYLLGIEAALAASDGIETATSFAYTPASWAALTPRLQQLNPAWTLLGSYHSHPGLGVFLSETDLDTQEAIFAQDWQVALVVDPVADELGFFAGKEGTPCPDWRILPDHTS